MTGEWLTVARGGKIAVNMYYYYFYNYFYYFYYFYYY